MKTRLDACAGVLLVITHQQNLLSIFTSNDYRQCVIDHRRQMRSFVSMLMTQSYVDFIVLVIFLVLMPVPRTIRQGFTLKGAVSSHIMLILNV